MKLYAYVVGATVKEKRGLEQGSKDPERTLIHIVAVQSTDLKRVVVIRYIRTEIRTFFWPGALVPSSSCKIHHVRLRLV
jgi:hypothetical protein